MPSTLDDLFEEIYGFRPTKEGRSYEMLAAAVCKLLSEKNKVFHDQRLKGIFSRTWYQIDVLLQLSNQTYFGEAKDYSVRKKKVGRGDLQKLAGALDELPVDGALFFSATDYTHPARQYAASSQQMIRKEINLLHIRQAVEQDENGRIKEIRLSFHFPQLLLDKAKVWPVFSQEGIDKVVELAKNKGSSIAQDYVQLGDFSFEIIYNKDGQPIESVYEILSDHPAQQYEGRHFASRPILGGYAQINDELMAIHGITYDIPIEDIVFTLSITAEGKPKLLVRDEQGTIDFLITDADLRRIDFMSDGSIRIKEQR
jgi:hypothetical protein